MPPLLSTFRNKAPKKTWALQPNCPLLQLPGELRNQIYHLVLVNTPDEQDVVNPKDELLHRLELRTLQIPALAATCRQIQQESLSYFFRHATFTYTITLDLSMHCTYRLDRSTKRWLRATSAEKFPVHDVVLSIEIPKDRKPPAPMPPSPQPEEMWRFDVYHIVASECTEIEYNQESTEHWWDTLYKRLVMKFSKARQVDELSVRDIASIMAQWVWMPTAQVGMFRKRWIGRGARVLGKVV